MATFQPTQYGANRWYRVSEAITNYGSTTKLTVETIGKDSLVRVDRLKIKRSAGTAATFTPRIYSSSTGVSGAVEQQFAGSSTAVADLFDVACTGVIFKTDAAGKFYIEPGFNAGADNNADIVVVYEVL